MARWTVGASRSLPIKDATWDGAAAQKSMFGDGDEIDQATAKKGHLVYDADAPELRGSYKLPFARVEEGTLTAITNGINACASRLPQTDIPDDVKEKAQAVIDAYKKKMEKMSAPVPPRVRGDKLGMTEGLERRYFPFELRAADEGDGNMLAGYAAVFDELSVEIWGFREKIAAGAFADTIAVDDIRSLWNHNTDWVLGRTTNETLRLSEDETGLAVEIDPPDTQIGRDAVVSIRRGDVSQMSFAFAVLDQKWDIDENEQYIRTLLRVKLYEVSPVTFPAYPATSIAVRAGEMDPVYGHRPQIPAEVQRALAEAASEPLRARARRAAMARRLRMAAAR